MQAYITVIKTTKPSTLPASQQEWHQTQWTREKAEQNLISFVNSTRRTNGKRGDTVHRSSTVFCFVTRQRECVWWTPNTGSWLLQHVFSSAKRDIHNSAHLPASIGAELQCKRRTGIGRSTWSPLQCMESRYTKTSTGDICRLRIQKRTLEHLLFNASSQKKSKHSYCRMQNSFGRNTGHWRSHGKLYFPKSEMGKLSLREKKRLIKSARVGN